MPIFELDRDIVPINMCTKNELIVDNIFLVIARTSPWRRTDRRTDGQTDRQTDRQTDAGDDNTLSAEEAEG